MSCEGPAAGAADATIFGIFVIRITKKRKLKFTPEQEAIFEFVRRGQGHGIIDAVAGAGKTTTIMECARFAAEPGAVLFCAFNNAIAREIGQKFARRGMGAVTVQTMHSLGLRILRDHVGPRVDLELRPNKYASLLRSAEMQQQLAPHLKRLRELSRAGGRGYGTSDKDLKFRIQHRLVDISHKHRSTLNGPSFAEFKEMVRHYGVFPAHEARSKTFGDELETYYAAHRLLLTAGTQQAARQYVLDFTDMIYLPFIWKLEAATTFDWIFIDECQDLSRAQFAVAAKYGRTGSRVLAVGDPRQSIYGFTGADAASFDRVARMTRATRLPLTTCFRCPRLVIDLAREIRSDITGAKTEPGRVETIPPARVAELARPGDLVISRLRAPLLVLIFDLIDRGVKVSVAPDEADEFMGELSGLFKRDELRASIKRRYKTFAALRDVVLQRNRWVIRQQAAALPKASDREAFLAAENDYLDKRLAFLGRKHAAWQKRCTTVAKVLDRLRQYVSAEAGAVRLSTIHRAKGLEEDRVFIIDYDQLPLDRPQQQEWEQFQEENLKYVAITRAKSALFLVESPEEAEEAPPARPEGQQRVSLRGLRIG